MFGSEVLLLDSWEAEASTKGAAAAWGSHQQGNRRLRNKNDQFGKIRAIKIARQLINLVFQNYNGLFKYLEQVTITT